MSRELIDDVLRKIAEVTAIIVETSKIKEDLDKKSSSEANLRDVFTRTKTQVNVLFEKANSVRDLFNEKEKEITNKLDEISGQKNGDDNSGTENSSLSQRGKENETSSQSKKPFIKVVDIKKLVEPQTLLKKEVNKPIRLNNHIDDAIVIISSDEDQPKTKTKTVRTTMRKAAQEAVKKTKAAVRDNGSKTDSSEEEVLSKLSKKDHSVRPRPRPRRRAQSLSKFTLSDTSSLSSDDESVRTTQTKNKSKKKETSEEMEPDWKKDPKFNQETYVKVLRIPCEKLKEYYLEKLDLLEISRLRDITSLQRKRRRKSDSDNSSRSSTRSKRKPAQQKVDSKKVDSDSTEDDLVRERTPLPENPETHDTTKESDNIEQCAEDALNLMNSDKEDDKGDSPSSNDESPPPVEQAPADENKAEDAEKLVSEEKEEEAVSEEKNDDSGEKESDQKDEEEPKRDKEPEKEEEKEPEKEQSAEEKEKDDENEDEEEKDEEKKDKKKKEWCKDKLLTGKLSSTDSEDEFQKYSEKRKKMQEEKDRLVKKRKKKAILSDSDSDNKKNSADGLESSSSSSSESEKESEKEEFEKPKSRKRVKRVRDSSDDDDEDKSTRKQIRNILGRDSLAESTKQAEAEEKERKARIVEKQKKYNQIYENSNQLNAKVEKVVLDFDEKNKKDLLKVDDELVSKLKPHQASGVQFMWDTCFESLERAKSTTGSGCILAHCMGLGKTLQVIALSHTLLVNSEETNVKKILVVSPLNTVLNWVNEFNQWLPNSDYFEVFELVSYKQNYERQYQVKTWHSHGGVLIIGYDMFRNLSNPENKRLSKKMRQSFQEALVDPGPDLVICDEGHLLKNEKTNISIAMNRIKTLRRIVLTGTPLQNNLKEYFCMVQFIKPNLLGTYKEYLNRFVNPITNGQYTDSTLHDIQIMRKRSHVLHKMLDGVVQRRDYSVLEPYLPPKNEYVLFLSLTETQIKLYEHYMRHFAKRSSDGSNRTSFLFVDFQALQRICTHPRVLLDKSIEMKMAKEKMDDSEDSEGSLRDFIDDDDEEEDSTSSSNSSSGEEKQKHGGAQRKRVTRATAALAKENGEEEPVVMLEDPVEKEWWQEYCDGEELDNIHHSSKLFLLFEILKECEQIGDKVLLFSQSLYSLNVIEYFLGKVHDATQNGETLGGYSGSWCNGLDYFRLDGSSSCDSRNIWCKTFNDPSNTRSRLFLISTRAGGLGINLVAANRVVIFDVSWNPSHDIQSIYRVYRFGQNKPCYVYRFVTLGTMEMKIYERQVTKQAISKRVIDEQQIDRHYNQNDLSELYKFEPDPGERPIPLVPKDVLLGELLQKYEERIYKYHEHQTLLENKQDEELNEEERKAAWEEFENEKKQRSYLVNSAGLTDIEAFLGSGYMRPNSIELGLASLVRKENPTWNDTQIRAMIPALHIQLQQQVAQGDLSMYKRVQQEIQILHAIQNQRLKEQYYQQQTLRMLQQQQITQQMAAAMKLHNSGWLDHYVNQNQIPQMPSTSRPQAQATPPPTNPADIIDLND